MESMKTKNIVVSVETWKELRKIAKYGDSMNTVIIGLLLAKEK